MTRVFDETGLSLCIFQAGLFEKSVAEAGGSSPFFIKCFMNSEEARHVDMDGFLSEAEDIESILEKLKRKHKLDRGSVKYSVESLYWMGYLYRYWCYTYRMSSRAVYGIIKAKELNSLYLPYHTMDPSMAIRRIMEAKNIRPEKTALEKLKDIYGKQRRGR